MKHTWTKEDDILTFYLYRYGEDAKISRKSVASYMGFDNFNSLNMRIQNFQSVDGKGGLENVAKLTKQVYNEYRHIDQLTHRKKCLEILQLNCP